MDKKLLATSALFTASIAMAFDTWIGTDGAPNVKTGLENATNTAGYWFTDDDSGDGGESKVVWPETETVAVGEGIDFLAPIIDYCGGVCGTAELNKGTLTYQPFVGVGFNVVGEGEGPDRTPQPGDASSWGGICITYRSDVAPSLELSLGDAVNAQIGYALPAANLSKSSAGTMKKLAWTDFKQPSWYKGATKFDGPTAAAQLVSINFKMQGAAGSYSFRVCAIGPYDGDCPASCGKLFTTSNIAIPDIPDQEWTGSAICPDITVMDDKKTLVEGTNYTVECSDNVSTGTAQMTITGIGYYDAGVITKTFKIVPKVTYYAAVSIEEDQDGKRAIIDGEYKETDTVYVDEEIEVSSVILNRTFSANTPATIVLPLQLPDKAQIPNADFYGLDNVVQDGNGWKATMKCIDEITVPKANTPYVVILRKDEKLEFDGKLEFKLNGQIAKVQTSKIDTTWNADSTWYFTGVYSYKTWGEDDDELGLAYAFSGRDDDGTAKGDFGKIVVDGYAYPLRAYLRKRNASVVLKKSQGRPQAMSEQRAASVASLYSVDFMPETIEVEFVKGDANGNEHTTFVGRMNTRTGEIKLIRDGRNFDLKGRYVGKPQAKGMYFKK